MHLHMHLAEVDKQRGDCAQKAEAHTDIADAGAKALLDCHDLVYDLMWPQVSGKAALACCTEGAPHWAAHLHGQPNSSASTPRHAYGVTCIQGSKAFHADALAVSRTGPP